MDNSIPVFRSLEQQNRLAALENAVRHRLAAENSEAVVHAAERYFQFLQKSNDK